MKTPAKLDLAEYLPYLVNRVGSIVADQFGAEALAPHGLSIAMWRVMAALASNGAQRQIDLSDLTSIDASTLSRLVSRLMRTGIVTRTRSASSNREVIVKLSAKGHAWSRDLFRSLSNTSQKRSPVCQPEIWQFSSAACGVCTPI